MPDPAATFRLVTFGAPALRSRADGGDWQTVELSGKPLALLIRVVASGTERLSRNALAAELWSDIPVERAKAQFRTALWTVRKRLPGDALLADDAAVSLVEPIACDRADFQRAIQAREYDTAITIYTGEFLAHSFVSGARGFEEWAELERRNLRGLFVFAAEAQARSLTLRGRFSEAVALAERARHADAFSQGAWRALVQALISACDTVRVRAAADDLVAFQAEEGIEFDPETLRLLRLAKASTPVAISSSDGDLPESDLIGRERDLAGLVALVDLTDRRRPALASVVGPPGIGKSRLLRDFTRAIATKRGRAVAVAAPRTTEGVPYATLASIVERLAEFPGALSVSPEIAATLVALHPALSAVYRSTTPAHLSGDVRVVLLAVAELVRAIVEDTRLTIVVDDAQWLDGPSRAAIESLPSTCANSALLIVLGERLGRETPVDDQRRFLLSPLTESLTEAMVASMGQLPDDPWASSWVRALFLTSGGVPLGVLDVVRLCVERGVVSLKNSAWSSERPNELLRATEEAAPRRARIEQLPEDTRRLALLLGVAGSPIDIAVAATALGTAEDDVRAMSGVLVQRGIGFQTPTVIGLAHEEYGTAARDIVAQPDRQALLHSLATTYALRDDLDSLRRAYGYADASGNEPPAESVARRFTAGLRATHPERTTRDALADLMGLGTRGERLDTPADRIDGPRRRARRTWYAAVAAGIVIAGASIAMSAIRRAQVPPDAELVIGVRDSTGATEVVRAPIRLEGWTAGAPLEVSMRSGVRLPHSLPANAMESPTVPGRWIGVRQHEPPRLDDLTLVEPDGRERLIASADGDDVAPSWSPDGRHVVFVTARWTGRESSDLAIADVKTDSVVRVTAGNGYYDRVAFNWDGSGLAYYRTVAPGRSNELCTLALATHRERCHSAGPTRELAGVPTWLNPTTVRFAYSQPPATTTAIAAWDLDLDRELPLNSCDGAILDHYRLLSLVVCAPEQIQNAFITPISRPGESRPLDIEGLGGRQIELVRLNSGWHSVPGYRGLRIVANRDATVGIPHALRARAVRSDSGTVPVDAQWEVLRGDATVGPDGAMVAAAPGEVVVRARVGDLADTIRVNVHPREATIIQEEVWNATWLSRWRRFGVPFPQVVRDKDGNAFWNAGDGNYYSGAYTRGTFDFTQGLAVDFQLETPITRETEQRVALQIFSELAGTARTAWDHRTGWPMVGGGPVECRFEYPAGMEGPGWGKSLDMMAGRRAVPAIAAGRPYTVRLQLFPDGRCGVAVNGEVQVVSSVPDAVTPVRITTYGSSVGTKILVRRVTVWAGVPADINWPAPARASRP